MTEYKSAILRDLADRSLLQQTTADEALDEHLASGMQTLYCGFDPTADSLHIGSLVPLLALKRMQLAGHKPIALVGGATGLIGDPSFKAAERQLNSEDVVAGWVEKLRAQVSAFIDFDCGENSAEVVNNLDWTQDVSMLDFLRDIGKHFSVNMMIQKESVKQRLGREGAGISFTEFTYMLLQSFDFAELYKRHGCTLQLGGSDQWGNITGGIDLTRRMYQGQVFGVTLPLVTKADGTKFGKTESGTIWLDPKKTSPYAFYQFWINTADADVYKFLRYFTFLSIDEIEEIEATDAEIQGRKTGQGHLAREVTRLVHGEAGLEAAVRISEALFSGDLKALTEPDLEQLALDGMPSSEVESSLDLQQVLVDTELAPSRKKAREFIQGNAVAINGDKVATSEALLSEVSPLYGRFWLMKRGKKAFHLAVQK